MTKADAQSPATDGGAGDAADGIRKTRSIRFTDAEWREVRTAAKRYDLPAAEFVRERILAIARGGPSPDPAALAPLIVRTFRYSWMLATRMRNELDEAGRGAEMESLVEEARDFQERLQNRQPADTLPGSDDDAGHR